MNYKICWKKNADFCDQIIQEINTVRHKPCAFAPYLQEYIDNFDDSCVFVSHIAEDGQTEEEVGIELEEGKKVLTEALQFLVGHPGMLKPLNTNQYLQRAAYDHYQDIAPKGLTQHKSSDGKTTYKDRIEKHAVWGGTIFEGMQYGQRKTHARDYVLSWIIDDGFENRIHRKHLFQSEISETALIAGPHERTEFCIIAMFASQILTKEEAQMIEEKNREKQAIEYRKKMMQDKNWNQFAKDIFKLQNKVRSNPKSFIGHLEKCLGRFKGLVLYSEDNKSFIETKEGPSAYVEAIEYLRNRRGMKEFIWSDQLEKAGKEFVNDIGPKGLVSSLGSDGSLPTDRINKYGTIDESWGESNIYGGLNTKEVIERLLVCDGQPTRGFRTNLFNDQLLLCGVATGLHASHDNMIQIEYVKGLLNPGEAPTINVQIEDDVPKETVDKLIKMGINKNRLKICHDPRSNEKKIQSLISVPISAAQLQVSPPKNNKGQSIDTNCQTKAPKQLPTTTDQKPKAQQHFSSNVSESSSQFLNSQKQKIQNQAGIQKKSSRPSSAINSNKNQSAQKQVRKPMFDNTGNQRNTLKTVKSPKEQMASKIVISPDKVNYSSVSKQKVATKEQVSAPSKGSKTTPLSNRKSPQHNFSTSQQLGAVKGKTQFDMPRRSAYNVMTKTVKQEQGIRNQGSSLKQNEQNTLNVGTLDSTKDANNSSQFSSSKRQSFALKQRAFMRSPQPESAKKDLQGNHSKPPINTTQHGHTRSIFNYQQADHSKLTFEGDINSVNKRKSSYIGLGSNHAQSRRSYQASQGSDGDNVVSKEQFNRNPILLLNPQNKNEQTKSNSKELDEDFLYKTYDSKSNQEVFSEKMNLKQQETSDLVDETPRDSENKPMEYQQFLEILDQSANNITPRNEVPGLKTPISPKTANYTSVSTIAAPVVELQRQNISSIKGDKSIQIPVTPPENDILDQSQVTEFTLQVMPDIQQSEDSFILNEKRIEAEESLIMNVDNQSRRSKKERRPRSSRKGETPKKNALPSLQNQQKQNTDHKKIGSFGMADCDDFIKQLNEKENIQNKSRHVPQIENQGSTFNPIKSPGSPKNQASEQHRVSQSHHLQTSIRNKTTQDSNYRDSLVANSDYRQSISATPQFATPAGELRSDRESKLSIHGVQGPNGSGIFTSSPEKTDKNEAKAAIFDMDNDPDRPHDAINQSVIIEEIDINGCIQKVHKKTYQLINGQTKVITRIMHN